MCLVSQKRDLGSTDAGHCQYVGLLHPAASHSPPMWVVLSMLSSGLRQEVPEPIQSIIRLLSSHTNEPGNFCDSAATTTMLMPALFSVMECAGEAQRIKGERKESRSAHMQKLRERLRWFSELKEDRKGERDVWQLFRWFRKPREDGKGDKCLTRSSIEEIARLVRESKKDRNRTSRRCGQVELGHKRNEK